MAWAAFSACLILGAIPAGGQTANFNLSAGCTWPSCAPTCDPCKLKPIVLAHENAVCKMGMCLCKPTFCAHSRKCIPAACHLGAVPPPYQVSGWATWFARLAPASDPPHFAGVPWWIDYASYASQQQPLFLAGMGCLLAVMTSICLFTGLEHKFGCLPKSPLLLLIWAGMLMLLIGAGCIHTHWSMRNAYDYGVKQVEFLHWNLQTTANIGLQLNASCNDFITRVDAIAGSCKMSVARTTMGGFVDLGHKATKSKFHDVSKLAEATAAAAKASGIAVEALQELRWYLINLPLLPNYLMLVGCVIVIITTVVWRGGHHAEASRITECADMVMLRMGDVCIPLLAALAGLLGAAWLLIGMVAGKFCAEVDGNMMAIARSTNWSAVITSKSKLFDVNTVMQGAAQYYIFGNTSNPMTTMLESAASATHLMDYAIQKGQSASNLAGGICPGLNNLSSSQWVAQVDNFVHNMSAALTAEYVWPHYQALVRVSFCNNIVGALGPLFIVTTVLGLFCFPIFGLLAEYDLEEWLEEDEPSTLQHEDTDNDNTHLMKSLNQGMQGHFAAAQYFQGQPQPRAYGGQPRHFW